jgi:hypothetical protein
MKYSEAISNRMGKEKTQQIREDWKRESGPQFGMILEVMPSSLRKLISRERNVA